LSPPQLVILGGLPGVGKTAIARELARAMEAVLLRIDTIEVAIWKTGMVASVEDAGYRVAYALAEDNLRLGRMVIADSVNPIEISRSAWRETAARAGAEAREVEVVCSDPALHRRRVETRVSDIEGFTPPRWDEVEVRAYEPWTTAMLVIDTADRSPEDCAAEILRTLEAGA
jgi:predicted kinase